MAKRTYRFKPFYTARTVAKMSQDELSWEIIHRVHEREQLNPDNDPEAERIAFLVCDEDGRRLRARLENKAGSQPTKPVSSK